MRHYTSDEVQLIVEAVRTIDSLHNLGDAVYAVREREGAGWTGEKVTKYSHAHQTLRELGVLS